MVIVCVVLAAVDCCEVVSGCGPGNEEDDIGPYRHEF